MVPMPHDAHADTDILPQDDLALLRAQNAVLAGRVRTAEASAASQAMRAQAWSWRAGQLEKQIGIFRRSLIWRMTLPVRVALVLARGVPANTNEGAVVLLRERIHWRRAVGIARRDGLRAAIATGRRWRQRRGGDTPRGVMMQDPVRFDAVAACMPMVPSVVIVAELSVPQCAKYRVWQKQEHFARLGVQCRVIEWHDTDACLSAVTTATQMILYRVPATPEILALMDRLRALGVPFAWEVDDLIFDEDLYRQNSNLADLDENLRASVLDGVVLYRRALQAAGRGIASTPELTQAMRAAGVQDVAVVENALDQETLDAASAIRAARRPHDGVVITYGSGTKTHDTDFRQAAPALLRLLQARPDITLRIVGVLTLPTSFDAVAAQVERVPPVPYARYLALLGDSDISIAPLEPSVFNDAKSNIKFLEAAIVGVPSVCSPRAQFRAVMRDGENGFLADDDEAWFAALSTLADDGTRRMRLGQTALADAMRRYAPAAIARDQVAPLIVQQPARAPGTLRVLMANVFYAPRSYGGATIVVEEMARRLHAMPATEIAVVTSLDALAPEQVVTRRVQDGITVFALPVADSDIIASYDDPQNATEFGHILDALKPDIVHLHSVQTLSATLAAACSARSIRYVITLHDPWWLCARQFMVRDDGTYCFQRKIDLRVCEACFLGARHIRERAALLRGVLDRAALLISPSAAHRELYLAQGIAPEHIVVAPNGVRLPLTEAPRTPGRSKAIRWSSRHSRVWTATIGSSCWSTTR